MAAPTSVAVRLLAAERVSCSLSRCSPWKYSSSTSLPCRAIRMPWICGRVHRLHRRVEDLLDELLDGRAIDVRLVQRPGGPAVVARRRRAVVIARRVLAARIEVAVVAFAPEVVGPAALGKAIVSRSFAAS